MGMKKAPAMPPPVDNTVIERTEQKEAELNKEKEKLVSSKKKGMYGTVLTSGLGDVEEANTGKTMLGGTFS